MRGTGWVGMDYEVAVKKPYLYLALVCMMLTGMSLLGVVLITNTPLGQVIAFVRIVFSSVALPLETVMLPLFASELFGNKSFNKCVGMLSAASTAVFAIGAPFANLCYDMFGNYNVAFVVFSALMLFVTFTMQFLVAASHRDRRVIESAQVNTDEFV